MNNNWIGFDLDGTLADHEVTHDNYDPERIGKPIPKMLAKCKKLIKEGKTVKILTARVQPNDDSREQLLDAYKAKKAIRRWCKEHIGQYLDIVAHKDGNLECFYDDRAIQVERNTGEILGKDLVDVE